MDNEYLRHLDGSVYIDEGLGDRLKSWGSSLAKKFSGGTPALPTTPDNSKTAYARIIKRTLEIIVDAVKSDFSHVPDWMEDPSKLPMQWGQVTEEEGDEPDDDTEGEEGDDEEEKPRVSKLTKQKEFVEFEGEFLYNFAGKYKKFRKFSTEVKPIHVSRIVPIKDLGYSSDKEITVYWVNDRHYNIIQVSMKSVNTDPSTTPTITPTTPSTSDAELLGFWDDWVNPKAGVSENFSLKLMMNTANPPAYGINIDPLEGADPALITEIGGMCNGTRSIVGRTFYAVVIRKSMEFKPKQKGDVALRTVDNGSGDVWRFERGTPQRIKKNVIIRVLGKRNKESEILRRSLVHVDYFKKNPDVAEPPPLAAATAAPTTTAATPLDPKVLSKTYHHFDDAVLAIIELSKGKGKKISRTTAEGLVLNAWNTLIAAGNAPDKIEGPRLMQTILSKVKKPKTATEALINPFQGPNFLQY